MDLEDIVVSEISQTKTNTVGYHLYMESKKYSNLPNITKRRGDTDIENKLMVASVEGEEGAIRGGEVRDVNYWVYDRLKDVLYNTGNIANIL